MNALPGAPGTTLAELRLALHRNGYTPVPVSDPNPMLSTGGKAPFLKDWRNVASSANEDTITAWSDTVRNHGNTGLLCGDLVGLDLDLPRADLADRIGRMADAMLGTTPLHRIGRAPKSLRCYRAAAPTAKLETAELLLDDGTTVQVEALGTGQQFVSFGIHPGTGQPYVWPQQSPLDVSAGSLPVVDETALRDFLAAAEAVLRTAGGRTKAEREKDAAPVPEPSPTPAATVKPSRSKAGDDNFFSKVNKRALERIEPWFKAVFRTAEQQPNLAWRVSSADLGRALEEDLSMHPTEGGHDWGTRQSCSPIDVVMEWGGAPEPMKAALYICEKLNTDPATLGWKPPRPKRERPKPEERTTGDKPLIRVQAGELHTMTTAAEAAILSAGVAIYQRGNSLVRPVMRETAASHGRITVAAALAEMSVAGLLDVLCDVAEWEKFDARAGVWVRANPPRPVAEILLARVGFWRVPVVAGVVTTPTMRPDGSILDAAGYDPVTRLYHAVDPALKLHSAVQKPTRADAEKALALLTDLLAGFPFTSDVSRAVALAALVTPVVRGAIPVAPMTVFRAPTPGSGKSYAVDVSSVIATGRICPVISAASTEDETEKRLVGLLLAGYPIISLDNVNGELGGDLLCQAIERPFIRVRRLGVSDITEIESRATITGTGNNMRVKGDMTRRTLIADLDAGMERPETRTFASDPVATIQVDRSRYVSACLIVVRAYLLAGQPGKLQPIASFAEWSGLVRSALVWLGCADPAQSMEQAREDDPELGDLREVMDAWKEAFGTDAVTVRHAIEVATTAVAQPDENGDTPAYGAAMAVPFPALKDALLKVAGTRGIIDAKRLGMWLAARKGRPIGRDALRRGADTRKASGTWMVGSAGR